MDISIVDIILNQIPIVLTAIGVLVGITNIIVEVLKKALWDKIPTNFLVVIVAHALTLPTYFAWTTLAAFPVRWYWVTAAVVVGFMVAYGAMYGFDKLKEALAKVQEIKALKK